MAAELYAYDYDRFIPRGSTGGKSIWAWDRIPVVLRKGKNSIRITFEVPAKVDHLNIL